MTTDLQVYFLREVLHALLQTRRSLSSLAEDPRNKNHLRDIRRLLTGVRDLAMVHGFDGIEQITGKLFTHLLQALSDSPHLDADFIATLDEAVIALERVVVLEDEIETRTSIELINHDLRPTECETKSEEQETRASAPRPGEQLALLLGEPRADQDAHIARDQPLRITDAGDYEEALSKTEDLEVVLPVRPLPKVSNPS